MEEEGSSQQDAGLAPEVLAGLRAEVAKWRSEGLISASLAERLLSRYGARPRKPAASDSQGEDEWPRLRLSVTPGMVLLYLGGLLVLVAASLLLSQVWPSLGRWERFVLVMIPTVALYWAGARLARGEGGRTGPAAPVLLLFGCLLVTYALSLGAIAALGATGLAEARARACPTCSAVGLATGGAGHLEHDPALGFPVMLLAFIIHVATYLAFRSPLLTLPYPISAINAATSGATWLARSPRDAEAYVPFAFLLAGALLLGAGHLEERRRKPANGFIPSLIGAVAFQGAFIGLAGPRREIWLDALVPLVALGFVVASLYQGSRVFLVTGAFFLTVGIFALGLKYFADTAGLPLTLLLCGGVSMLLGYLIQRMRKEHQPDPRVRAG